MYEDGEDASKAQYVSKKEDIRSIAGPIIQRYNDKIEGERQAIMEKQQKEHAAKQAELERAKREAEAKAQENKAPADDSKDTEMADAEAQKPDGVDEA